MAFPLLPVLAVGAGVLWYRSMKKSQASEGESAPESAPESEPSSAAASAVATESPSQSSAAPAKPSSGKGRIISSAASRRIASKMPRKPKSEAPVTEPAKSEPPKTQDEFAACMDEGIPVELRADLEVAFKATDLLPADYREISGIMEASGYPKMAACFKTLADKRFAEFSKVVDKQGGLPHTIRQGDIPSLLATYYTGDAARFRDLGGSLNKNLGKLKTVGGVSNYEGWKVGAAILIPKAWNPLDKPLPPTAQGPAPKDSAIYNSQTSEA
jgi:hypothetical protein